MEKDKLPYSLYNPLLEGKLIWMCNYDDENRITSVFCYNENGNREKICAYIESLDKAKYMRDELIKEGWQILSPPKITFQEHPKN